MPTSAEAIRALFAAWRLFLGDRAAAGLFDASSRGFFASFAAILYVLPFLALILVAERAQLRVPDPATFSEVAFVAVRLLGFVVEWFLFLGLMVWAVRLLRAGRGFGAYVVAHNWTAVIIAAAFLAPIGLGAVLGGGILVTLVAVVVYALALRCLFTVATATLGLRPVEAFAVVLAELVLAIAVAALANRVLGL
jgi:hypothetical protein